MNCKNCGALLEEGMLFCLECGTKVEAEEKPAFTFKPVVKTEDKTEESAYFTEIRSALDKLEEKVNSAPKFDPAILAKLEASEKDNASLKEEIAALKKEIAAINEEKAKLKAENEQLQQKFAAIQSLFMGSVPNTPAAPAVTPEPAPAAEPGKKVCPNCGSPVEDGFVFCGECGSRI